jgi:hypothetical protein
MGSLLKISPLFALNFRFKKQFAMSPPILNTVPGGFKASS